MTIDEIDFAQLYRDHMAAAGGRRKPPEEWDRRAAYYTDRFGAAPASYAAKFIELTPHGDCGTLLDVGCGPGLIALALAPRMTEVWGLDYSPAMLARMEANAAAAGLRNVSGVLRSWEDDWSDVPACDLVVASRSTAVMDLDVALKKLDAKARRRVCLTSPVGGRFIPPEIFEALGRSPPPPRPAPPDYIYVVNLLHRMGRLPKVNFIANASQASAPLESDALISALSFSLGELSGEEKRRLTAWRETLPEEQWRFRGGPSHWAFISWET
ncbi:class I SAM-dependent methyltransferase [Rhodoblastus sp.]|uniref:class I SAM-dependent methyltransferase n=1 Tax=Rhodoblastus sp. TaxID=1962975 RepID=UPI0026175FE0|nr:class I SAM-dependent methyltransferase [Rhodoblastus sp.]